jgi:hypothetical protein
VVGRVLAYLVLPRIIQINLEILLIIMPNGELAQSIKVSRVLGPCFWIYCPYYILIAIFYGIHAVKEHAHTVGIADEAVSKEFLRA